MRRRSERVGRPRLGYASPSWALALALACITGACGETPETPPAPRWPVALPAFEPKPDPTPVPQSVRSEARDAVRPYTRAQLEAGFVVGRSIRMQVREVTVIGVESEWARTLTVTHVDEEGYDAHFAWIENDGRPVMPAGEQHVAWSRELTKYAFAPGGVHIMDERVPTPIGTFDCVRYTYATFDGGRVHRLWFAKTLPGPPIRRQVIDEQGYELVSTMVQNELGDVPPEKRSRDAVVPASATRHITTLVAGPKDARSSALSELLSAFEDLTNEAMREAYRDAMLPALPVLTAHVQAAAPGDRFCAVVLLGEMGRRALPAVAVLVEATRDTDWDVRQEAMKSVAWIASPRQGPFDDVPWKPLHHLPHRARKKAMRWNAEDPEAAYGTAYTEARELAAAHLWRAVREDPRAKGRRLALSELARWGPHGAKFTERVLPLLASGDGKLRGTAAMAVRMFRGPPDVVVPALEAVLQREDPRIMEDRHVLIQAVNALKDMGHHARPALDELRELAKRAPDMELVRGAIAHIEADNPRARSGK